MDMDNTRELVKTVSLVLPSGALGVINTVAIIYLASDGTGIVKDSKAIELAKQMGYSKSTWGYYVKKLREFGVLDKRWDNYVLPKKYIEQFERFLKVVEIGDYCKARDEIRKLWEEADNPYTVALVVVAINYLGLKDLGTKENEMRLEVFAHAYKFT